MRRLGLQSVHRRRAQRPSFDDLVAREFAACAPDRLWVADITQHPTREGSPHISVVLDAYSRSIVDWAIDMRATRDMVASALDMALQNRQPGPGVIHHSEQSVQTRINR